MTRVRVLIIFLVGAVFLAGSAFSEPAIAANADPSSYVLRGFRSAHFGMTEAQVRNAIAKDFKIRGTGVESLMIPVGRTPVLAIRVASLFPQSGGAEVAYLFGYHSNRLVQVSLTWSPQIDPTLTGDHLIADGKVLQSYFLSLPYPPNREVANTTSQYGLAMFQGVDPEGHATALLLQGEVTKSRGRPVLKPEVLRLNYIADPLHPDVMKSLAGQF